MPQRPPVFSPEPKRRADNGEFYRRAQWRKVREMTLRRSPLCESCGKVANEVHHITPRTVAPSLAYAPQNLRCLCRSCHSKETMVEQHARGAMGMAETRMESNKLDKGVGGCKSLTPDRL